jgi:2-keto-3-deoxy-L-rhamnonate aldolase RhmA
MYMKTSDLPAGEYHHAIWSVIYNIISYVKTTGKPTAIYIRSERCKITFNNCGERRKVTFSHDVFVFDPHTVDSSNATDLTLNER